MCEHHQTGGAVPAPSTPRRLTRRALLTTGVLGAASLLALRAHPGTASADDDAIVGPTQLLRTNRSGNLWPVPVTDSPSSIGVRTFTVPGTSAVKLSVVSGDASSILLHVAARFHAEVEPLQASQCGAYSWRANVNNPSVWSNHASGSAIDLNWALHPNGRRNTFTPDQVSTIRTILDECQGVVRWGGDYTGTVDEMHFELNRTRFDPLVAQVADEVRAADAAAQQSFSPLARQRSFAGSSPSTSTPDAAEPTGEVTVPGGPGTADGVHPG